jgi:FkbM family methyltransferase
MTVISYAQNFEDVMLWRALQQVENGFYVDIGANDPVVDSVTKWFYDQGWSGINIEPITHWFDRLSQDRPRDTNLQLAISSQPGPLTLYDIPDTGLATLDPAIAAVHRQSGCTVHTLSVPVQTLDAVLSQHAAGRDIHFLKIDVEGAEREALESASLQQIRPWIVLVEATEPRSPVTNHHLWEHLLTTRGYQFAYFDGLNRFYLALEHSHLLPSLQVPPNTFDRFMRLGEWQARSDNHHLRQQLTVQTSALIAEKAKNQPLRQALEANTQQLQAWQRLARDMQASTSWRITAPLRALKDAVKSHSAPPDTTPTKPSPQSTSGPTQQTLSPPSAATPETNNSGNTTNNTLLLHQITSHWRLVDLLLSQQPPDPDLRCALCGHSAPAHRFKPFDTQCQFGGGRLLRHQCPACDVIFGPSKMLALTPAELSAEYDFHYRIFTEGDSTDQEVRAFFALDPQPGGHYLNYGAGAWSRSVELLRTQGWNITAYEPTASAQQQPGLITQPQALAELRFDGIYSNNVLEHLRQPVDTLRQLARLLTRGGRMSHATPCYEYLYEYTRFHLFFFLGRSRSYLAQQANLDICHHTVDGHYINTVYQPRAA